MIGASKQVTSYIGWWPLGAGVLDSQWPALSATGDKLAHVTYISDGHPEICRKDLLIPRAPGVKVISSRYEQRDPQYSPDGKHMALDSTRGADWEVCMSDGDGTHLVQISNFKDQRSGTPHWSPDNQKIVFNTRRSNAGDTSSTLPNGCHGSYLQISPISVFPAGRTMESGSSSCRARLAKREFTVALPLAGRGSARGACYRRFRVESVGVI
jgi:WD40 repeat protein